MYQQGFCPDPHIYDSLLQGFLNMKTLPQAKLIHARIIERGLNPETFAETKLVTMYAKCGSLLDARRALEEMPAPNVVSWTAVIAGHARFGHCEEALSLFHRMQRTGIQRDQFAFTAALTACANLGALEHGKEVHGDVISSGFQYQMVVGNALVAMYGKCGSIEDARQVFEKMSERNVVSWTAMITAYAQNGYVDEALELFQKMPERNVVSWTAMIAAYGQNGLVEEAMNYFNKMAERDVVSWNAMFAGYAQNGCFDETLKFFQRMQLAGVKPNSDTFVSVLSSCANLAALHEGQKLHECIIKNGLQSNIFVANVLVDMYAKCCRIENACKVFENMPRRDVVSWNAMISGYMQNGQANEALGLFQEMSEQDVVSWNTMIAGCAQNGNAHEALKLFQKMPERNVVSWNAMIAGYAQNEHIGKALQFFSRMPEQNVVSWNAMIAGYTQNGYLIEALELFRSMQLSGVRPNGDTFASILPACANLAALHNGKGIHEAIVRSRFRSDVFVANALVDMYAKCGSIHNAYKVFDKMPSRNVVSWNAMIAGYAMHGCGREALKLFEQMRRSGIKPDHVTFVGVLSACCHAGLVDEGWQYFQCMGQDYHIAPEMEHYCCMVGLLGRAGLLNMAHDFIGKMPIKPDVSVWGALLGACRIHANIELGESVAERLFESDPENASHYVVLSNIYAAAGRWDDVEMLRKLMKVRKVKKMPGYSWIEVNKKVYAFVVGDRSHPQTQEIYAKLETLSGQMKEAGYVPNMDFVLHDVGQQQKDHILNHHSEKLAIAFGLVNTSPRTSIRIVKNLRMCGDCHSAIKFISKIVEREIIVRDTSRFHHFRDGQCSCGDYW